MTTLVFIFAMSKAQYEIIGKRIANVEHEISEGKLVGDNKWAKMRHAWTEYCEMLVVFFSLSKWLPLATYLSILSVQRSPIRASLVTPCSPQAYECWC